MIQAQLSVKNVHIFAIHAHYQKIIVQVVKIIIKHSESIALFFNANAIYSTGNLNINLSGTKFLSYLQVSIFYYLANVLAF